MNVSPNILAKNWNLKKLKHRFVDERALITTTVLSPCNWKTLVPYCLREKRPESTFLTLGELSQNRTEKRIMPTKTTVN